jgi:hypothetical protein
MPMPVIGGNWWWNVAVDLWLSLFKMGPSSHGHKPRFLPKDKHIPAEAGEAGKGGGRLERTGADVRAVLFAWHDMAGRDYSVSLGHAEFPRGLGFDVAAFAGITLANRADYACADAPEMSRDGFGSRLCCE